MNDNSMFFSIKRKLFGIILAVSILFLIAVIFVNGFFLKAKIFDEMQKKMGTVINRIRIESESLITKNDDKILEEVLQNNLGYYGIERIDIISGDGNIVYSVSSESKNNNIEMVYPKIGLTLLKSAKIDQLTPAIFLDKKNNIEIVTEKLNSIYDYFLVVKANSLLIYKEVYWDFTIITLQIFFFLYLACWLLFMFINRQNIKKINEIGNRITQLSNGDYDPAISISGTVEIDNLSSSLNQVAVRLKNTRHDLKKFYYAIEQTADMVLITDKNGLIEYVNPALAKLMKYSQSELIGQNPRLLKSSNQNSDVYPELWNAINSGKNWVKRITNKTKDGIDIPILTSISPIFDHQNKITHFIAIQKDISKEIEIENKLSIVAEATRSAEQAKGLFLASMSHEIRTPMNIILGMTQLLSETNLNDEQVQFINTLKNSGCGLLNIINDILDFSKIEAGQMSFEETVFSLKEASYQSFLVFQKIAIKKGLKLKYFYECDMSEYFIGDPARITQILNNLISNALKFTESGEVSVLISKNKSVKNGTLLVKVVDTGVGIHPSFGNDIFKVFSQGDSSIQRKFGGTGLGLAINKKIVEHYNGEIWYESQVGIGTTFFLTLDLIGTKKIEKSVPLRSDYLNEHSKLPLKILLAEDIPENVMVIKALFKKTSWEFDDCANGEIAVEKFARAKYDIVFMDIELPVLNGLDTTKKLRQIEQSEQRQPTPIIGLSAHALKEFKDKMLDAGCDNYIVKPLSRTNLSETIVHYCFGGAKESLQ